MNAIEKAIEKINTAITGEEVKKGVLDGFEATDESIKRLECYMCIQGIAIIVLALTLIKQ